MFCMPDATYRTGAASFCIINYSPSPFSIPTHTLTLTHTPKLEVHERQEVSGTAQWRELEEEEEEEEVIEESDSGEEESEDDSDED